MESMEHMIVRENYNKIRGMIKDTKSNQKVSDRFVVKDGDDILVVSLSVETVAYAVDHLNMGYHIAKSEQLEIENLLKANGVDINDYRDK